MSSFRLDPKNYSWKYTQGSKTFQYLEENKTMSVRSTDRGTRRSDAEGR